MLFAPSELRSRARSPGLDRRAPLRISTGTPRIVESSPSRRALAQRASWQALLDGIHRSAQARLMLMEKRGRSEQLPCPWARVVVCDGGCRCGGARKVTIAFLRAHYEHLALEIVIATRPSHVGRRP